MRAPSPVHRCARISVMLLVSGCTVTSGSVGGWVAPWFADANVQSLAVFPLEHDSVPPDIALELTNQVAAHLHERSPGVEVVGPSEAAARLQAVNVMADWERFLFTYLVSGIPDAVALGKLCDAVGIDALVHLELATIVQRHRYYDRSGPIPAANRVTVRAWMFDCVTAQPLWELSSRGEIVRYTMRSGLPPEVSQPPPVVQGVQTAVEKLLPRLPLKPRMR